MEASAQEKEEEKEEIKGEREDGSGDEEEEQEDGAEEDQEDGADEDKEMKEEEAMPHAAGTVKNKSDGLNLNNEVVKMRKEVKRVRALIIRKLTRQIGALKKKKGKETEIERNQRRAARLLEEIHALKTLSPDLVTKTALQKNLNFEEECKNPKSTISNRAIARIATHPQFSKKIEAIKAAVKAFKEERMKEGKQGWKEKVQNKAGKVTLQSPNKKERKGELEEDITVVGKKTIDNGEEDGIFKDSREPTLTEPEKETGKATQSADIAVCEMEEIAESKNVKPASVKCSKAKDFVKDKPQSQDTKKKPNLESSSEVLPKKKEEVESDVESSDDEEKEYFDDSTEERFHKQSSQSEESDDDDFFVGKVSKYKKKKQKSADGEKRVEVKVDPTDKVQSELDELESRLKSKATSFQSVFCSLSSSKPGGGRGAGRGRGRGGDTFRGQGKPRGGSALRGDFRKQHKFQRQETGTDMNSGSSSQTESSEKGFPFAGRGKGRGRGDIRQKDHRGGRAFSQQAPQQALHPSWEASKKRKEQQGQILAFQGKKIKFDDD